MKKLYNFVCFIFLVLSLGAYLILSYASKSDIHENSIVKATFEPISITPSKGYKKVFEDVGSIEYNFELFNNSEQVIQIKNVKVGCGCTIAELNKNKINPHEHAELKIFYDVLGQIGELPNRETVLITNHPEQQFIKCSVGGYRSRQYSIDPPTIDFGTVQFSANCKKRVSIGVLDPSITLVPEKIMGNIPGISARVSKKDDFCRTLELLVTVENVPLGNFDGNIFIPRVEDDGKGPLIPVIGCIVGPIKAIPSEVFLGIVDAGEIVDQTVCLISSFGKQGRTVAIESFGQTPKCLQLERDITDKSKFKVTFNSQGMVSKKYRFETEIQCIMDQHKYKIQIPVSCMVIR